MDINNCTKVNLVDFEGSLYTTFQSFVFVVVSDSLDIYNGSQWGISIIGNEEEDSFLFQFNKGSGEYSRAYQAEEIEHVSDFIAMYLDETYNIDKWASDGMFYGVFNNDTTILDEEEVGYIKSVGGDFGDGLIEGMKGVTLTGNQELEINIIGGTFSIENNRVNELNEIIGYISSEDSESIVLT